MKLLAKTAAIVGGFIAATSTIGCWLLIFDEPKMPDSLL